MCVCVSYQCSTVPMIRFGIVILCEALRLPKIYMHKLTYTNMHLHIAAAAFVFSVILRVCIKCACGFGHACDLTLSFSLSGFSVAYAANRTTYRTATDIRLYIRLYMHYRQGLSSQCKTIEKIYMDVVYIERCNDVCVAEYCDVVKNWKKAAFYLVLLFKENINDNNRRCRRRRFTPFLCVCFSLSRLELQ